MCVQCDTNPSAVYCRNKQDIQRRLTRMVSCHLLVRFNNHPQSHVQKHSNSFPIKAELCDTLEIEAHTPRSHFPSCSSSILSQLHHTHGWWHFERCWSGRKIHLFIYLFMTVEFFDSPVRQLDWGDFKSQVLWSFHLNLSQPNGLRLNQSGSSLGEKEAAAKSCDKNTAPVPANQEHLQGQQVYQSQTTFLHRKIRTKRNFLNTFILSLMISAIWTTLSLYFLPL